jgi:hypothetical protein
MNTKKFFLLEKEADSGKFYFRLLLESDGKQQEIYLCPFTSFSVKKMQSLLVGQEIEMVVGDDEKIIEYQYVTQNGNTYSVGVVDKNFWNP